MGRQDEAITKLQRDKKNLEDSLRKTQDELTAEEDKVGGANIATEDQRDARKT